MGILNCTTDSFFEGGRYLDTSKAIHHGLKLIDEGADIIDIGGESTRPGSRKISDEEEIKRVIPVIEGIRQKSSCPISIDTYKPHVAEKALNAGANFLNDITGFAHRPMQQLAKERGVPICVMHALGAPHTTPQPIYNQGVITEIYNYFQKRIELLLQVGVSESQIILDPGIGGGAFGKTIEHNLQILKNIRQFHSLGFPLLIGLSRKSFIQKILKKEASEILSTTVALNTMAMLEGVAFIRVHDVQEHRDILKLFEQLQSVDYT